MKVILQPVNGTPEANLERAKHEMERVLAFRRIVDSVNALKDSIEIKISINPAWDLPLEAKISYLKERITAKVRSSFKVVSVTN